MSATAGRPPVSVCLASYNGAQFIRAQLESVLAQLLDHDEVIVSDDGSHDSTVAQVQALQDPRIRLLQHPQARGVIRNFETALAQARHAFVFLCDQDDLWLPGKVDRCVQTLQLHPAVLVVTDCQVVDANLVPIHASFFAHHGSRPGVLANLWRNHYLGCCMAFRQTVLRKALPMPTNLPMHDMWIGLVAQLSGPVVFLPEVLSHYRRHAQAASDAAGISRASRWQQLGYRLRLVMALAERWLLKR
jgi:glycosyltransferase involved in cell wall biosynthesis